ncbi:MAG: prolyl oligopeptidase family serine peptidase, partial [Candidatus Marinimicrobia bacterium]|nr:prolyl oligopeptidase family serine peptidase [Candidatus Neomarinimicrobiota bacterium]
LSDDGTISIDWWNVSPTGKYFVYGISEGGSERSTLYILNTETKEKLDEEIPQTRACSIAWLPDEKSFYYTRYPLEGTMEKEDLNYYRHVYLHTINADHKNDEEIFGVNRDKEEWPNVTISPNGKYLFVIAEKGWEFCNIFMKNLETNSEWTNLTKDISGLFSVITAEDNFYIKTNYKAPKYRIFKIFYDNPEYKNWSEIIPESDFILKSATIVNNKIILSTMENAYSRLYIYNNNGEMEKEIKLPSFGTAGGISSEIDKKYFYFSFSSFNFPRTIFKYKLEDNSQIEIYKTPTKMKYDDIVVKQIWYKSKDETPISMFLVHKKGIKLNGKNPTLVYGYGGFNVNMNPYFSQTLLLWLNNGGVYAYTNLRGGGEYGEEWHKSGMLMNKQNTFDDFISAGEWLIENNYTNSEYLSAMGGSNGGLLSGAVLTQRPDLYKAVVIGVPLLDMIRYHKFLIARLWIPEYGSSENKKQMEYILKYSPYQNVKETKYPATLITTATSDSRVAPLHARKMAALLQKNNQANTPILVRIEHKAGHSKGKPKWKIVDGLTDRYSFLMWQTGMEYK